MCMSLHCVTKSFFSTLSYLHVGQRVNKLSYNILYFSCLSHIQSFLLWWSMWKSLMCSGRMMDLWVDCNYVCMAQILLLCLCWRVCLCTYSWFLALTFTNTTWRLTVLTLRLLKTENRDFHDASCHLAYLKKSNHLYQKLWEDLPAWYIKKALIDIPAETTSDFLLTSIFGSFL